MRSETARKRAVAAGDRITLSDLLARRGAMCGICVGPIIIPARNPLLKPSIDHIVPTSRGGRHIWGNVQPAHLTCNIRKGDRMPFEAWTGHAQWAEQIRTQAYLDYADELADRVADRVFVRLAGLFTRGAGIGGDGQEAA